MPPPSSQITLAVGDESWTVSIEPTLAGGFHLHASCGKDKTCSLDIDQGTAVALSTPSNTNEEDAAHAVLKYIHLSLQSDGNVQLALRPPTKRAEDRTLPLAAATVAPGIAADGTAMRPHTAENFPSLPGASRRRLSIGAPMVQATESLPCLDPVPSPVTSPSRSIQGGPTRLHSSNWVKLIKVVRRVPVFDLEEAVLRNTYDVKLRVDLGFRYSEEIATEVPAMILLEQASFFNDNVAVGWRFWATLGDLHYSLLARYPRYHRCFAFHLQKSTSSFAKALSYLENVADSSLIVKYAAGLFMKGERELPYELLKSLSLTYASNGSKLEPAVVVDRHALLFRVSLANSIMHEAILHVTKLIELVTADPSLVPKGYTINDFHLMLARCAQIEGDYLFATNTFSRILAETFGHSTVYSDDQFFALWYNLGTKCYDQGLMWLCIEYYTLALTYAKNLSMRATIYYRRGMAFFCINEPIKAEDDYRRAKSANHEVKPDVTLNDLKKDYLVEFNKLLDTPVEDVIKQVRKGMGKTTASIKVQRHFRHFMQQKRKKSDASRIMRRFSNSSKQSTSMDLVAATTQLNAATTGTPPAMAPGASVSTEHDDVTQYSAAAGADPSRIVQIPERFGAEVTASAACQLHARVAIAKGGQEVAQEAAPPLAIDLVLSHARL
ncbi:hypothetical protein, variant [Aphanomyces invadans]|uniref:Uncharacterized protein n=1 Tax=Aphanomyces invadans TaxID=157072 RepID=A0A024UF85_9STRA|nr:hypothetical protein, variant [Aphanomyces invadans]ETW04909.1 hypothetical protein, variant [Aphanomyces invadans]|eukprot:XP_008866346.1 hypothetical protein, variant [Aphanomyces invadans]